MSRSYRNTSTDSEHVAFIVVILLACGLWTHKAFILEAEHTAKFIILFTGLLIALFVLIRTFRKLKHWRRLYNPKMALIDAMTGLEFERYVAKLLKGRGYKDVRLTEEYDFGVDIIASKGDITWGIQVKRYSGLVGADAVRQAVTALPMYHCDRAMVITNSTFSRPAVKLANANDCVLIGRDQIDLQP